MTNQDKLGSRFVVDLGDIKLPHVLEKRVESEIQAIVLRALAESESRGDQRAPRDPFETPNIWDLFPGQTLGLWIGDRDAPPVIYSPGRSGHSEPLTARDHTLIMNAIMENPLQVARNLPSNYKSRTANRPSGAEVLQAALQVEEIDGYTKSRMRAVLEILPMLEEAQASASPSVKRSIDELREQLTDNTFEEQRNRLRDSGLRSRYRNDGIAEGMEIAAQMLEDGANTIYSPNHRFYELLQSGQESSRARAAARDALSDISSADTVGATAGGAVGSVAGGVGAGPGAVAGGTGASVGMAIAHVGKWIYDWF